MRMRIISGKLKGRFIRIPQSEKIRPTTDRVRETLFNLLNNRISFDDISVLDLYSGSGSLGLECFSRGALKIDFVEKDNFIFRNLKSNIESLDASENCTAFRIDAIRFTSMKPSVNYDLILADPPFFKFDIYNVVENVINNNYLRNNGIMIIERSIQTKDKDSENFKKEPFKIIGDTCLYEIEK